MKLIAALAVLSLGETSATAAEPLPLAPVEAKVRSSYPSVAQLSTDALSALQASATPLAILDTRSKPEFDVSHIEGARHVDPGIWASTFAKSFGPGLKGKTVVVYCSVGMRSSKLAERIADAAKENGAAAVYNLEGGLFRWHNEGRPLVNANGPTDAIHPYDASWGRYLTHQDKTATEPAAPILKP